MKDLINKFQEELPASWEKKIKSEKLKKLVADQGMWFGRPSPMSQEGRNILKLTMGGQMYPTIDMKATGVHIRRIMERRNITVKDVQRYLNLSSVQSVYHWLNGRNMPTVDNLYALSELFRLSIDEMLIGNRKDYISVCNKSFYVRMSAYYKSVWKSCMLQN